MTEEKEQPPAEITTEVVVTSLDAMREGYNLPEGFNSIILIRNEKRVRVLPYGMGESVGLHQVTHRDYVNHNLLIVAMSGELINKKSVFDDPKFMNIAFVDFSTKEDFQKGIQEISIYGNLRENLSESYLTGKVPKRNKEGYLEAPLERRIEKKASTKRKGAEFYFFTNWVAIKKK